MRRIGVQSGLNYGRIPNGRIVLRHPERNTAEYLARSEVREGDVRVDKGEVHECGNERQYIIAMSAKKNRMMALVRRRLAESKGDHFVHRGLTCNKPARFS